jgi:hypothetical protein
MKPSERDYVEFKRMLQDFVATSDEIHDRGVENMGSNFKWRRPWESIIAGLEFTLRWHHASQKNTGGTTYINVNWTNIYTDMPREKGNRQRITKLACCTVEEHKAGACKYYSRSELGLNDNAAPNQILKDFLQTFLRNHGGV